MMAARVCACGGCQPSLEGRRANAVYFDGACRVRAHRARKTATASDRWAAPVVTLARAPRMLREAA